MNQETEMTIYVKNISKSYKNKKALQNCTLTLNKGIYALLGPNGAGKSTFMNILVGNLLPDSGAILYQDEQTPAKNIREMDRDYRAKLGFMPQYPGMYPNFTVEHFMQYMAYLKHADKKNKTAEKTNEIQTEITDILKAVELYDLRNMKIQALSGGMKQRLALAQAVLGNPSVLILDEPTAGLDPKQRISIRNYISKIALDKIVLIATHIVSDIEWIAQSIVMLKQGVVVDFDSPHNLIAKMDGKVWESLVEKEKLSSIQNRFQTVNIVRDEKSENFVRVRVLSEEIPFGNAVTVTPSLEDYYLYIFGEEI